MIKFNFSHLRIQHVRLKDCTTALGGAIRIVDERESTDDKEVYKRIAVPFALVRSLQLQYGTSSYINPIDTVLVYYEDQVVCLERKPYTPEVERHLHVENRAWTPNCVRVIDQNIKPATETGEWFTDGYYIYQFKHSTVAESIKNGVRLTEDGHFRAVSVQSFKLSDMSGAQTEVHKRKFGLVDPVKECVLKNRWTCAYVSKNGMFAVSAPIQQNLTFNGKNFIVDDNGQIKDGKSLTKFNETYSVSLEFGLQAGSKIGALYGHEILDALCLEDMMVTLGTVNLPNLPVAIKRTTAINMSFLQTFAWLIGISGRANSLNEAMTIRNIMQTFVKRGVFDKAVFNGSRVYKKDHSDESIEVKSPDECIAFAKNSKNTILSEKIAKSIDRAMKDIDQLDD